MAREKKHHNDTRQATLWASFGGSEAESLEPLPNDNNDTAQNWPLRRKDSRDIVCMVRVESWHSVFSGPDAKVIRWYAWRTQGMVAIVGPDNKVIATVSQKGKHRNVKVYIPET